MVLRPLEKFFRLSRADRRLLLRSVVWLATARLALWVMPFKTIRQMLNRGTRDARPGAVSAERIAWAIEVGHKFVPRANCLPQALAAEALLARNGHPVDLRIGVVKTDKGRLQAHAWVESEGRVIVGDLTQGLSTYTPMPPLPDIRV